MWVFDFLLLSFFLLRVGCQIEIEIMDYYFVLGTLPLSNVLLQNTCNTKCNLASSYNLLTTFSLAGTMWTPEAVTFPNT